MTTMLHLPRRHRRPLLFPPGLLALAWLLWLGCVALPQTRGAQKPQTVTQVMATPLHSNVFGFFPPVYSSEQQLEEFRNWQTITFTGNQWGDYFSFNQAGIAIEHLKADSTHKLGLRIAFGPSVTYGSLVRSIDLLNTHNIANKWLDFYRPTTIYAFTSHSTLINFAHCDTCNADTNAYSYLFPKRAASITTLTFFHPDWRNTTFLLLLMALLSAIRLYRQRRTSKPKLRLTTP